MTISNNGLTQKFTEERISLRHKTVTMWCVDRTCKCTLKLQLNDDDFDTRTMQRKNVSIQEPRRNLVWTKSSSDEI